MSGTHLYYNDVLFRDCELMEFAQVIEREKENTDVRFSRFRITVASTLVSLHSPSTGDVILSGENHLDWTHPSTIAIPAVNGESIIDRMNFVAGQLQQDRRDFWFALNATTGKAAADNLPDADTPASDSSGNDSYRVMLAATGIDDYAPKDNEDGSETRGGRKAAGQVSGPLGQAVQIAREDVVDMNNGPKVTNVSIAKISGGRTFRVQFTIEVCRAICVGADPSAHPVRDAGRVEGVISNRWSISETLGEDWSTSISIEGTLIVSDHRYKPDSMRLMASTALFPRAKLKNRRFFTSADGLELRYAYTLEEAGVAPPPHIVDWSGRYLEKVVNGGHCTGSMSVKLRGKHTPPNGMSERQYKLYLSDWVFRIIRSRLAIARGFDSLPGNQADSLIVNDFTIAEDMKEPVVEASVLVTHSGKEVFEDFSARLENFGAGIISTNDPTAPGYDPHQWPIPPAFPWDTESASDQLGSIYDGYHQNPCSQWHAKPRGFYVDFDVHPHPADAANNQGANTPDPGHDFQAFIYDQGAAAPALPVAAPQDPFLKYGWSNDQLGSGFTYLHVEIDNKYHRDPGKIMLPLSRQRTAAGGYETAVAINVHAGIEKRVFTMVASRQGDWPKVPEPAATVTNSSIGLTEHLLDAKVLPDAPKLGADGRTWEYSVQVQWTYGLSRTIGLLESDAYKAGSDPRDQTTPSNNEFKILDYFDDSGAII